MYVYNPDIQQDTYKITIRIKGDLTPDQVVLFAETVGFDTAAQATFEAKDGEAIAWDIEWLLHAQPELQDWATRLHVVREQLGLETIEFNPDDFNFEQLEDVNWLEESYKQFQPFNVGKFFIYGSHYEGEVDAGQIGLQIDAATAFGSGEHETTAGCLEAMLALKEQGFEPANILDLGTGSGILAIAATHIWDANILASDIDQESVKVTKHHCDVNDVSYGSEKFDVVCADGFSHKAIMAFKPYDLLIANILAGPLIEMSYDLCQHVADGGRIILSGILTTQKNEILAAYGAEGFEPVSINDKGDWTAIILSKD